MHRYQCKKSRIMKNKVNMTPPRETNKAPVTEPKEVEIYEVSDKELKIIILKSKVQDHTDRYVNKLGKIMLNKTINSINK